MKDLPSYVSFDPTYKPGASRLKREPPTPTRNSAMQPKKDVPATTPGWSYLKEPVRMATHGALPKAGLVDTLKEGQRLTCRGLRRDQIQNRRRSAATASLSGRPQQGNG